MKKNGMFALGVMAVLSLVSLTGCDGEKEGIKIGMVCIGNPETSTYDGNFKNGLEATKAKYGLSDSQVFYAPGVGEGDDAKKAAIDFAENGCDVVILDSYGHQFFAEEVANQYPNVKFISCTGDTAASLKLPNLYNAFAAIYEGRYLAGVAAGLKLNAAYPDSADDHVLGYVAAFPYAEVISGYTAFYLGAKSVCPDVTMKYQVTNSWGDAEAEKSCAEALIGAGCKVISQHADTLGAPNACKNAGIPNVSYNVSTKAETPDTYLCSSRINWSPYFNHIVDCVQNNKEIEYDWTGTYATESVVVGELGTCAAPGTEAALAAVEAQFAKGELDVFDTNNFTVDGQKVTSCIKKFADGDKECIVNGVFKESLHRSAPYFDLAVDGITLLAKEK